MRPRDGGPFAGYFDLAVAWSLANLCWIGVWLQIHFAPVAAPYYRKSPLRPQDHLAALTGVFLLAAVFWIGARAARRLRSGIVMTAARLSLLLVVLLPINALRLVSPFDYPFLRAWIRSSGLTGPLVLAAVLALAGTVFWHAAIARMLARALLFLLPFSILMLSRSVVGLLPSSPPVTPALAQRLLVKDAHAPRVVWVLFDELDQGLLFSRRPRGLSLPEIDRLSGQSISATNAFPPANKTLGSIPSLVTGINLRGAVPEPPSELLIQPSSTSAWMPLSTQPTVFSDARRLGFNTSVVGWYHPYCRILHASLSACDFEPVYETAVGRSEERSLGGRLLDQIQVLSPLDRRRIAIDTYGRILASARLAVQSCEPGLVFLHFPIPHAPAIFDRHRGRLTTTVGSHIDGYIGNLLLVDRTLGELRSAMETAESWNRTTLLLTSDHPWRQSRLFDGRSDERIPFLLKLRDQEQGLSYAKPFNAVITSRILMAILEGRVGRPEDVVALLDRAVDP